MNRRRQALSLCLDAAVVVIIQVFNHFQLKMLHGRKFLQIEQFAPEQTEEILHYCILQAVSFAIHTLPDTLPDKHILIVLVLVLPSLV